AVLRFSGIVLGTALGAAFGTAPGTILCGTLRVLLCVGHGCYGQRVLTKRTTSASVLRAHGHLLRSARRDIIILVCQTILRPSTERVARRRPGLPLSL